MTKRDELVAWIREASVGMARPISAAGDAHDRDCTLNSA